jgi:hypothetical protein
MCYSHHKPVNVHATGQLIVTGAVTSRHLTQRSGDCHLDSVTRWCAIHQHRHWQRRHGLNQRMQHTELPVQHTEDEVTGGKLQALGELA